MPPQLIKSFAQKTGKTVKRVEKLYKKAKEIAKEEYKITKEDEKFYPVVIGILKRMVGLKKAIMASIEVCENCKELIDENSDFCSYCGSRLELMDDKMDEALIKLCKEKAKNLSLDEFCHWYVSTFILERGNKVGNEIVTSYLGIKKDSNIDVVYKKLKNLK